MTIDLFSFVSGAVLTLAFVLLWEKIWGKLFGNRELRELRKRIQHLEGLIRRKDALIVKSLKSLEEDARNDQKD
jgi:hypothetical protein